MLNGIANRPPQQYTFRVGQVANLESIILQVAGAACTVPTPGESSLGGTGSGSPWENELFVLDNVDVLFAAEIFCKQKNQTLRADVCASSPRWVFAVHGFQLRSRLSFVQFRPR